MVMAISYNWRFLWDCRFLCDNTFRKWGYKYNEGTWRGRLFWYSYAALKMQIVTFYSMHPESIMDCQPALAAAHVPVYLSLLPIRDWFCSFRGVPDRPRPEGLGLSVVHCLLAMCLARGGNCAWDPVLETGPLKRHILTFYSVYPHSTYNR